MLPGSTAGEFGELGGRLRLPVRARTTPPRASRTRMPSTSGSLDRRGWLASSNKCSAGAERGSSGFHRADGDWAVGSASMGGGPAGLDGGPRRRVQLREAGDQLIGRRKGCWRRRLNDARLDIRQRTTRCGVEAKALRHDLAERQGKRLRNLRGSVGSRVPDQWMLRESFNEGCARDQTSAAGDKLPDASSGASKAPGLPRRVGTAAAIESYRSRASVDRLRRECWMA